MSKTQTPKKKEPPTLEATQEENKPEVVVRFLGNGRIEWEGFHNLYDVIGYLQLHVFQDWNHPVFQKVFLKSMLSEGKSGEVGKPITEDEVRKIIMEMTKP